MNWLSIIIVVEKIVVKIIFNNVKWIFWKLKVSKKIKIKVWINDKINEYFKNQANPKSFIPGEVPVSYPFRGESIFKIAGLINATNNVELVWIAIVLEKISTEIPKPNAIISIAQPGVSKGINKISKIYKYGEIPSELIEILFSKDTWSKTNIIYIMKYFMKNLKST